MHEESRQCQNCKSAFTIDASDFTFYEKIKVPPPTWCPECRYQRRLTNRNEWNFYRRPCGLCKKEIISIHNPNYSGTVYCQPCFWSDKWNPLGYGMEYDFSRPFFDQFKELRLKTPRIAMANTKSVNSEYTNQSEENKNCYLCVSTGNCENCIYGYWNNGSRDCVDCYMVEKCELLYESVNCTKCSSSAYLQNCSDCLASYFLKDCRGCTNCFGCYGLRGKSNFWFNEQLTKEEYQKRLSEFVLTRENIKNTLLKLRDIELREPHKYYNGKNNLVPSGDYLEETKYTNTSFNCRHAENIKYCQDAWFSKESYDCTEVFSQFCYEIEGCIANRSSFVAKTWEVFDSWYLDLCYNSHDLFGCISLRKKEYCILNKQYSKEEYNELLPKIIEHMKSTKEWGEFFPASISSFAYNETVAQDYFPLSKEEAISKGYSWYERKDRDYVINIKPYELSKTIAEIDDSILEKTILCKTQLREEEKKEYINCTTAFKITKAELDFYRKMGLPLPEKCFHDRRKDRMALRSPRKLWRRQCACDYQSYKNVTKHEHHPEGRCPTEFETSYAPDRPEIVYCEQCYQQEVAREQALGARL